MKEQIIQILDKLNKLSKIQEVDITINAEYFLNNTILIERTKAFRYGATYNQYRLITKDMIILEILENEYNVMYTLDSITSKEIICTCTGEE